MPKAGPCTTCPKRTGNAPELFPDVKKGDTCTDRSCYQAKLAAHVKATEERLRASTGKEVLKLSTEWMGPKKARLLYEREWGGYDAVLVKPGTTPCDAQVPAVFVDGPRMGQTTHVCRDTSCRVHFEGRGGSKRPAASPEERAQRSKQALKERREAEARRRIFRAVLERVEVPLSVNTLRGVCVRLLREIWSDSLIQLGRALGLEPKTRSAESREGDSRVEFFRATPVAETAGQPRSQ